VSRAGPLLTLGRPRRLTRTCGGPHVRPAPLPNAIHQMGEVRPVRRLLLLARSSSSGAFHPDFRPPWFAGEGLSSESPQFSAKPKRAQAVGRARQGRTRKPDPPVRSFNRPPSDAGCLFHGGPPESTEAPPDSRSLEPSRADAAGSREPAARITAPATGPPRRSGKPPPR
jgi:hypothetical protein